MRVCWSCSTPVTTWPGWRSCSGTCRWGCGDGRLRSDRVCRLPAPPRPVGAIGRPAKHGGEFHFAEPGTWPDPDVVTRTDTSRYGGACATAWDRLHPRLTRRAAWLEYDGDLPV